MNVKLVLQKATFFGGETVSGFVHATAQEQLGVLHATVSLFGESRVEWTEQRGNTKTTYRGNLTLVDVGHIVIKPLKEEAAAHQVAAGTVFQWPFAFPLPSNAPPSCVTRKGHVTYSIKLFVRLKGMFTPNLHREFTLMVAGSTDLAALPPFVRPIIAHKSHDSSVSRGSQRVEIALPRTLGMIGGRPLEFIARLNNKSFAINSVASAYISQFTVHDVKGNTKDDRVDFRGAKGPLKCTEFAVATCRFAVPMPGLNASDALLPSFDIGILRVTHVLTVQFDNGASIDIKLMLLAPTESARLAIESVPNTMPTLARIWRPEWQPDQAAPKCPACEAEFGLFTRRHHCRACGLCYCANCCRDEPILLPPIFGFHNDRQRVCVRCRNQPGGPAASANGSNASASAAALPSSQQQQQQQQQQRQQRSVAPALPQYEEAIAAPSAIAAPVPMSSAVSSASSASIAASSAGAVSSSASASSQQSLASAPPLDVMSEILSSPKENVHTI
jgi:hypothetical protein